MTRLLYVEASPRPALGVSPGNGWLVGFKSADGLANPRNHSFRPHNLSLSLSQLLSTSRVRDHGLVFAQTKSKQEEELMLHEPIENGNRPSSWEFTQGVS
jgi:hypothetical protein